MATISTLDIHPGLAPSEENQGRMMRIEAGSSAARRRLEELWDYRELLYFLAWRDIKLRYKQTALGAAWAVLQPLLTMLVFSVFFGRLARIPSDGVPYPVFVYTALVPWMFFANSLVQASNSLVANSNLLTKVYFPRLAMPMAALVAGLLDFAISFAVLLLMLGWYGMLSLSHLFWLPFFMLLAIVTALGVGLWLSALNVEYRDVRYVLPFVVQFWMFATPIPYPSSLLRQPWRTLYGINPMAGVVEGFRWSLYGSGAAPGAMIMVSALVSLAVLAGGILYFRSVEKSFADVI